MLPILRTAFARRGSSVMARAARPMSRTRRPYATASQQGTNYGGDLFWIIGSIVITAPAVAYLISGDSTTRTKTGQHGHLESSSDEPTKQQSFDAGSKASAKAPEDTEPEWVKVPEETPFEETGEGQPEATTGQGKGKLSDGDKAIDELSEKAKQTGIKVTEEAKEVKETVKDKVLPDSLEVLTADNHPRATTEENRKPYADLTHAGEGVGTAPRELESMKTQGGKQDPELFDGRGKK